jgi:valyl-tRNA synthetase
VARAAWARNEVLIRRLARVETLTEVDAFPKGTVTIPAEGATFGLPLAGVIDVGGEKARLEKTLEKLMKELAGMEGRLRNAAFVASAPEEVVAETREQVAQKLDEAQVLRGALQVNGMALATGDALLIEQESALHLNQGQSAEVLVFDLAP